ncbi:MAG: hypothetical protein M1398_02310, partial [Deltaproteobacteria bacterium]|nr:hypothetical protein [Deltaproteobacteria bacterium]
MGFKISAPAPHVPRLHAETKERYDFPQFLRDIQPDLPAAFRGTSTPNVVELSDSTGIGAAVLE